MRFNDEEKKIKAKAKSYGIPLASYCKYLILNSINKNGEIQRSDSLRGVKMEWTIGLANEFCETN